MNLGQLPSFVVNPDPAIYLTGNYVVVDLETTNIDKGWSGHPLNQIVFACWKCAGETKFKYSWGNEFHLDALVKDIEKADFVVAQNSSFEISWLQRIGVEIETLLVYDTMLAHRCLAGNRRWKLALDDLIDYYKVGDHKSTLAKIWMQAGLCPSQWLRSVLKKYGIMDVVNEEKVFLKQRKILYDQGLLPVTNARCLFTPALTEISLNGACLDPAAVNNEVIKQKYRLAEVSQQLDELTGGINFKSAKQVREYLYTELKFIPVRDYKRKIITTGTGELPTGEAIIAQLKIKNAKQRKFLELYKESKKLASAFSKFLTPAKESIDIHNSMLYAQYSQTTTATHRLASTKRKSETFSSIQLQNPPRKYKPMFTTRNVGWKIVEVDFSGAEFASAGILSGDTQIAKDIANPDFDIHTWSANTKYKLSLTTFKKGGATSEQRQNSKQTTFKPMFGGMTPEDWVAEFRDRYKDLAMAQTRWQETVLKTKELTLNTGLKLYWPDCEFTRSGYITRTTEIYNFPIQSFVGAEWTPGAIVCLWHRMKSLGMKAIFVNTLHDSLIAEVPEEELGAYSDLVRQAFLKDMPNLLGKLYGIEFTIPLAIDITIRDNWNNPICKECKQEYSPFNEKHPCLEKA